MTGSGAGDRVLRFGGGLIAAVIGAVTPLSAQEAITPEVCAVTAAELAAPDPVSAQGTRTQVNGLGRFWRLTAASGQVSYLWGSLHSSDPAILALPSEVEAALGQARVLILESDPRAKSRTEIAERALQAGVWLAPSDQPWDKPWLTGPARVWAEERVAGLMQDDAAFAALTDMGLASLLLTDPCEDFAAGAVPTQDLLFLLKGLGAGLDVASLEPWDAFLTEMSQPERKAEVQALARINAAFLNPEGYHMARVAAFRLYLAGQIADLRAASGDYLASQFGPDEAARLTALADRYLIGERNQRFARALAPRLEEGGVFAVVGAFHLPGEDGLLSLLQAKGYRVERLPVGTEAP